MNYALIFAFLSPIFYALMNTLDKFTVAHKVKNALSFSAVVGLVNILYALIVAIFLDWTAVSFKQMIFPAAAGIFIGIEVYLYYIILKKEDASYMIGLIYVYPILVAIFSFLFLHEVISLIGYIGMFLTLFGVVMLSIRINKIRFQVGILMLVFFVFLIAGNELFMKVATDNLPVWNSVVINNIFLGLTVLFVLFHPKYRKDFPSELKNIKWAFMTEVSTFLAVLVTYLAMDGLPVTIVSSIGAIQPLAVLFFEWVAHRLFGKMTRDESFVPKLIPITIIVIGVILLYISELFI